MLNYHWIDKDSETLVVFLHGFMGDMRTYQHVDLPVDCLYIDLPGHGQDHSPDVEWSFSWIAEELYTIIEKIKRKKVYLFGYSMGGRIALYYALHYALDGLILESTSPGIEEERERAERRKVDKERGENLETDYQVFVKRWEQLPLFQTAVDVPSTRLELQHLIRSTQQPKRLKKALMDYGTGSQPNLWSLLYRLDIPVLLLTGTLDIKFQTINQRMKELLPNCHHIEVQAGHTIHVEHPDIFDTIVLDFIKEA